MGEWLSRVDGVHVLSEIVITFSAPGTEHERVINISSVLAHTAHNSQEEIRDMRGGGAENE